MGQKKVRLTKDEFIARARAVHGDRYDYSQVDYQTAATPVTIICPEHGPFYPRPNNHVSNRSGCPTCSGYQPTSLEQFVTRARAIHGDRYDYGRVVYRGVQVKAEIICPEHGPFWQIPLSHTQGRGCAACGAASAINRRRMTRTQFIERARAVHGERYDYGRVQMTSGFSKVEIICAEHGAFLQTAHDHLCGNGCTECAGLTPISRDEFVSRATTTHGDRYSYGEYHGWRKPAEILCAEHGAFRQIPKDHAAGSGCPICARESTTSQAESALSDWVESLGMDIVRNDRETLGGVEMDIYVPSRHVGIEYNGSWWHCDEKARHYRYHEHKANRADKAGVRLFTVWDFDLKLREALVKRHIAYALGVSTDPKLHARATDLVNVDRAKASAFYDEHHLQGGVRRPMVSVGLMFDGDLVACMSFLQGGSRRGKFGDDEWELIRYATSASVRGGASRLFSAFIKEHAPRQVWSFSDRQHFAGALYTTIGFECDGEIAADYRVVHPQTLQVWRKAQWQRRLIPSRLAELGINEEYHPETDARTERDMQSFAKVLRVYDSGKTRWRWTP